MSVELNSCEDTKLCLRQCLQLKICHQHAPIGSHLKQTNHAAAGAKRKFETKDQKAKESMISIPNLKN